MLARPLRAAPFGHRKPMVRRMGVSAPGSSGLAFPDGMNDARYTGMTEMPDETFECVASTTYNKYSWQDYSGAYWNPLMETNVTANDWRMHTREGPRFRGYTNVLFNWMYLELYGEAGDHADGTQWEGGYNTVTFKNCHFRGLTGSHTLMWCADGATGAYVFEDCIFTTDSTECHSALKLYADAGFGTVTLSMKNCYVQETGWTVDQFEINRTGDTYPADVVLWDNVRNCTWNHTTKTFTSGSLITQPSGT
jgi:hypothetical protein